jgi:hypothetical protein
VNGYVCGSIVNGCPGKNVEFKFGAETATGPANNTENGGYVRPFSLTVDVIDGFVLQTRIVFDGYAVNHSSARFGNTARIDTITVSEGFDLDLGEGDLARNGDTYAFLPTLPAESTTTTTTPFGTTTTTMSSGTTTTTTLPDCAAAAGLAAARCRLDAVLARPLCGDPLPKGVEQRVRAPLRKAVAALQRAIDAPTAKQPRFVRRALAALDRTNAVVAKAVAAKRAPRAMPAACGQAINAATSQARATIP